MNNRKTIAIITIFMIFGVSACNKKQDSASSTHEIQVEEEQVINKDQKLDIVRRGDVTNYAEINCNYRQLDESNLAFSTGGERIYRVYTEKGCEVKKGDLLVELDVRSMEDAIKDLEYDLTYQNLMLEQIKEKQEFDLNARNQRFQLRLGELSDTQQIAEEQKRYKEDVDAIKSSYRKQTEDVNDQISILQNRLDTYKQKILNGRLYATMDGVVTFVKEDLQGSICEKDEKVVTIIDNTQCAFTAKDIKYKEYFKEDTPVMITTGVGDAAVEYETYPVNMKEWQDEMVFKISGDVFELEIGTRGKIRLELETSKDTLMLSKRAVHKAEDKYYVYVEDKEGFQTIQYVEIGLGNSENIEILSGLNEGDYVILQ